MELLYPQSGLSCLGRQWDLCTDVETKRYHYNHRNIG
jgi:hypothetical protein